MPLFDKDNFVGEIIVNPPEVSPAILTGSSIVGRVKLTALKTTAVRGVLLQYRIIESYGTQPGCPEDLATNPKDCIIRTKEVHRMECLLLGSRLGPSIDVVGGEYYYPFVIPVPVTAPPSLMPKYCGSNTDCCTCCCKCCGQYTNVASITHQLQLEVIIPFSLLDKNDVMKEITVWSPVNPATLVTRNPRQATHVSQPQSCVSCCPCLSFLTPPIRAKTSFTIEVPTPYLSLNDSQFLPFLVNGCIECPFTVALKRKTTIMWPNSPPKVTFDVVAHTDFAPLYEGRIEGHIPTAHLIGTHCPATLIGAAVRVAYFVEVLPHFDLLQEGACVGFPNNFRAEVAVDVFHCASDAASVPTFGSMMPSTLRYERVSQQPFSPPLPPSMSSNSQVFSPSSDVQVGIVFSYAPPLGYESDFVSAGPILEVHGPPVWGTVVAHQS